MFNSKPVLFSVLATLIAAPAFAEGDAEAGEKVFKKCKACHEVGEDAKSKVGPVLNNIVGHPAEAAEGFKYSKDFSAALEKGWEWTDENLAAWLKNPNDFLTEINGEKSRSKMTLKLKKEDDITNVIAYLATFSEPKAE